MAAPLCEAEGAEPEADPLDALPDRAEPDCEAIEVAEAEAPVVVIPAMAEGLTVEVWGTYRLAMIAIND